MKTRIIAAALAVMMCAVSCGSSGESSGRNSQSAAAVRDDLPIEDSISSQQVVLDGEYATVIPLDNKYDVYGSGLDKGLDYAIESYRSQNLYSLLFSADRFEMLCDYVDGKYYTYDGTYSVADGKIDFHYENYKYNGETKVNIDEEVPDYDKNIISAGSDADSLQGLSDEEKRQRVREENTKMRKKHAQKDMERLNETGTYREFVVPLLNKTDYVYSMKVFPLFITSYYAGINVLKRNDSLGASEMLYSLNDLICVPTYGFKLNGSYSSGNAFTIVFNPLSSYTDNNNSEYNINDFENWTFDESTKADYLRDTIKFQIGNLEDTTIEFSNGKWIWTNSEGKLINNGYYMESDEHPGLIGMCIDRDSEEYEEAYTRFQPYIFYIADDGTIWYPNWVKMD